MNVAAKQLDYLSAGIVDSYNLFSGEIEQENKFIQRIKSKIKVLQLYSSSPANDIYYFGNSFDSSDYVDFSKIKSVDLVPAIEDGRATLSSKTVRNWYPTQVTIGPESNGFAGNNHTVYSISDVDSRYRYYFKDTLTSRSKENVRDNNPLTFFEYEKIHINQDQKTANGALDFEFKYSTNSNNNSQTQYVDWSTFDDGSSDLILTMILESQNPSNANYIEIVPYFGNDELVAKDVMIEKIEVTDNADNVENVIKSPIYISASFIPSSATGINNFFYKKANIKFSERRVKSIKLFFIQPNSTDVKIQHVYFSPDKQSINPYKNQTRFNPNSPAAVENLNYPEIPWKIPVNFSVNQIVPSVAQPNVFKADIVNSNSVEVSLQRDIPILTGKCVKVKAVDGSDFRITNKFYRNFALNQLTTFNNISENNQNHLPLSYVNGSAPRSSRLDQEPFISTLQGGETILQEIVNWLNNDTMSADSTPLMQTKVQKRQKLGLHPTSNAVIENNVNSVDTQVQNKSYRVPLVRQFEIYNAQRKTIAIRDISVGYEEYNNSAEIVSREYDTPSDIEFITLSCDVNFSGPTSSEISELVKQYISVDNGTSWIEISTAENPFTGVPEIISFNQNIEKKFQIPRVLYLNSPDVPNEIKKFILKITLEKPATQNITPIIYSYKVGAKVRQS